MAFKRIIDLPDKTAEGTDDIVLSDGSSGVLNKTALQDVDVGLFNDDGTYTTSSSDNDRLSFSTGMTDWSDGLSNEEINRFVLQSGESLIIERLEFRQKGGGSSSNASVRVRDTDEGSTYGSQTLGGITKDAGETATGNTIQVQVSNNSGNTITASAIVVGRIIGA